MQPSEELSLLRKSVTAKQ